MTPRERIARLDAAVADRLASVRRDDARRRVALVAAVVLGLALAWVHWLGLVAGGALVGLTRRGLARAVAAGAGFGAIAILATVVAVPGPGPGDLLDLSRLGLATVVVGVLLPAWGALVRGVA